MTTMSGMFAETIVANPDMSLWDFSSVTTLTNFINSCDGLSVVNYSNALIQLDATSPLNNQSPGTVNQNYNAGAAAAHAALLGDGWTLTDNGQI